MPSGGRNQHQPSRGITTSGFLFLSCPIPLPESTSTQSRDYNSWRYRNTYGAWHGRNQHQPSRGITTTLIGSMGVKRPTPESTSTQSRDYNPGRPALRRGALWPESTSTQSRDYNLKTLADTPRPLVAGININPVAGLQHTLLTFNGAGFDAGININPVAGLQPA